MLIIVQIMQLDPQPECQTSGRAYSGSWMWLEDEVAKLGPGMKRQYIRDILPQNLNNFC